MRNLIIHAGMPKTATTFLQKKIFRKLKSVSVRVNPKVRIGEYEIGFQDLFNLSTEIWRSEGKKIIKNVCGEVDSLEESTIISAEGIWGGIAFPQPCIWESDRWRPKVSSEYYEIDVGGVSEGSSSLSKIASHLENMRKVASKIGFDKVKVLISIRRQDETLASQYAYLSDKIIGASQKGFESWAKFLTKDKMGYHYGGGSKLDYLRLYRLLKSDLKENFTIIPYEISREDPKKHIRAFTSEMNIEKSLNIKNKYINRQKKEEKVWSLKNRRPKVMEFVKGIYHGYTSRKIMLGEFDKEIYISEELGDEIVGVYRSSNEELDKHIKLPLHKFNYY